MNDVWNAISAKLENDATLLALLGTTNKDSILGEFEVNAESTFPVLVICYDGARKIFQHISMQTWTIYCHTKGDPATASSLLHKVKDALDGKVLSIDTDSGVACMECEWFIDVPTDHDPLFKTYVDGQRYHVYVRDI